MTRWLSASDPVRRVAITGGTHGNERCGLHVARELQANPSKAFARISGGDGTAAHTFELTSLLTNEKAIELDRRYADVDMNRCFHVKDLAADPSTLTEYERKRAIEIDAQLGPKASDSPNQDLILDLHNTTANTGVLVCFHPDDHLAGEIAAHLQSRDKRVKACFWSPDETTNDVPFLPSVARSGLTLEVGAVAHSTTNASTMRDMLTTIQQVLAYVECRNKALESAAGSATGQQITTADPPQAASNHVDKKAKTDSNTTGDTRRQKVTLEVAQRAGYVDFPRDDNGNVCGFVHPALQGIQELAPESQLKQGMPMFVGADGDTEVGGRFDKSQHGIDANQDVFPLFVNEAAYYEKNIAMMLTIKKHVEYSAFVLDGEPS